MDKGFVVVGSTNHPKLGFGSKDVVVVKLDEKGKIINQIVGAMSKDQLLSKINPSL